MRRDVEIKANKEVQKLARAEETASIALTARLEEEAALKKVVTRRRRRPLTMETKKLKINDGNGTFTQIDVRLETTPSGKLRLTVTGSAGVVMIPKQARAEALNFWISFFEESPAEIQAMNARCGTRFRSACSAAKYVIKTDGEYHGLDLLGGEPYMQQTQTGTLEKLLVVHSCGCIHEELAEAFPEYKALIPWHLNDMRAGCAHQRASGVTRIGSKCTECGYSYGSAWLHEELPKEIIALAQSIR